MEHKVAYNKNNNNNNNKIVFFKYFKVRENDSFNVLQVSIIQ
jgi:hypothetical protein